jgi:hypothetical protein
MVPIADPPAAAKMLGGKSGDGERPVNQGAFPMRKEREGKLARPGQEFWGSPGGAMLKGLSPFPPWSSAPRRRPASHGG